MGSIYSNAFITITAAATEAANDSLFGIGRVIGNSPPPCMVLENLATPEANVNLTPASLLWTIQIPHSPLQTQGWVFLERLMSTRIIHLTTYEACWECPDLIATEHQPKGAKAEAGSAKLMYN